MKKLKALKGVLISIFVVAAATCCIFAACGKKDKTVESDDTPIVEMTLDTDSVKRTFLTYQSFTSSGLEAKIEHESGNFTISEEGDLVIDSSAFDNTKAGEYEISVSYTENGVTISDSYVVEVIEEIVGLKVEKNVVDYELKSTSGVDIDLSDVKVYSVNESGVASTPLSSGEYELRYYKGGEEISSLKKLSTGIYTIYAFRDVSIKGSYSTINYECGAYVFCYVYDPVVSVEMIESTLSVYEQQASRTDQMSPTWAFLVTYQSGATETVMGSDMQITNLVTTKTGENKTAVATFMERIKTSTVDKIVEHPVNVTYTISGVSDDMYGVTEVYNFDDLKSSDGNVNYVYDGALLFDTFTSVGVSGVGTSTYSLSDIPEELEGLTLNGRVQLSSSKKLNFSMVLPGTVTVYGLCGSSSANYVTLSLTGNDDAAVATVVGKELATLYKNDASDSEKYVTFKCTAGDYTLASTDSTSANVLAIIIKYDEKEAEGESGGTQDIATPSSNLSLESIDLSLPQQFSHKDYEVTNVGKNDVR